MARHGSFSALPEDATEPVARRWWMIWLRRGAELLERGWIPATEPSLPGTGQGCCQPCTDGDRTEAVRPPPVPARRGRRLMLTCDIFLDTAPVQLAGPIEHVGGLVHDDLLGSL